MNGYSVYKFEETRQKQNLIAFAEGEYRNQSAISFFNSPMGPFGLCQGAFLSVAYATLNTVEWLQEEEPTWQAWLKTTTPLVLFKTVVRATSAWANESSRDRLQAMALDEKNPPDYRVIALYGLGQQALKSPGGLAPLLQDSKAQVVMAAARVLQPYAQ